MRIIGLRGMEMTMEDLMGEGMGIKLSLGLRSGTKPGRQKDTLE